MFFCSSLLGSSSLSVIERRKAKNGFSNMHRPSCLGACLSRRGVWSSKSSGKKEGRLESWKAMAFYF